MKAKNRARTRAIKSIQTIGDLMPDTQNANQGTSRGRALLDRSLRTYGAARSIVADGEGRVIAGNKTLAQAAAIGMPIRVVQTNGEELVVVQRTDLDLMHDPRARELALADNRVGELDLSWDPAMLKQHVAEGVKLSDLWFDEELEKLLGEGIRPGLTEDDRSVRPRATDIQTGDLFSLGPHRLLCGDATSARDVDRLFDGAKPLVMLTDPPFGVRYDAAWRHRLDPSQRTAVGAVNHDDRVDWSAAYTLFQGDVAYVWHASTFAAEVASSLSAAGFAIRSQIIWAKQTFALSRGDYHFQHEPCWYAVRRGRPSHWQGSRTESTLWSVPNLNPMGGERTGENTPTGHSTQKPVRLFERPLLNHTRPGDGLYDAFAGSGSAIVAAEKTGRRCFAMEIDPVYVQAAIDRWEAYRGGRAVRLGRPTERRQS